MKRPITIILAAGCLHRLLFLGARQLWIDELMQARVSQAPAIGEMLRRVRDEMDLASPLDFLIQRGISSLLGDSVWALRLHALVFGTLSIWIAYRIAKCLFGERVALYTAVLFAFYPLAYHYSLEARPYSLLLFLSLLSYDLLLHQVYSQSRHGRGWIAIAVVSALLLYTSFLGGLILMAQCASLALLAMRKLPEAKVRVDGSAGASHVVGKVCVAAYGVAVLVALALFYPWGRLTWNRPQLSPSSEILNLKFPLALIKGLGDNSYPVAALLLIGAGIGIAALWRHRRPAPLIWLLLWWFIPIPALLCIEIYAGYFFSARHLLHVTPPLLLLAGYGISHLSQNLRMLAEMPRRWSIPAWAYAAAFICATAWLGQLRARYEPADWRGTAAFLEATARRGDAIAMPGVHALLEYYDPGLRQYHLEDLDPGPGVLTSDAVKRRIVVCYELPQSAPCGAFKGAVLNDPAWKQQPFKGFAVFIREK
jgi:mannosyltransferase